MRIPKSHRLTHALIDRYGLVTHPFTMDNPEAYLFFGGQRMRHRELADDPRVLGFDVAEHEHLPPGELWARELEPFATRVRDEGDDAWTAICAEYDQYCIREFLELRNWSEGAIEMFGLLFNQESLMNSSFLEMLREEVGGFYSDLVYLDQGTDMLPSAMFPELKDRIRFGAKMVALDQSPDDVTVYYRTGAGRSSVTGDYLVMTVPFPVLRHVEVLTPFSRLKQRDPPAPLRRLGQGVPPVPPPVLGVRRRDHRRWIGQRPRGAQHLLPGPRARHRPRRDARELHLG